MERLNEELDLLLARLPNEMDVRERLDSLVSVYPFKPLKATLGESFSASYVKLKMQEWDEYSKHLTEWERTTTLDC